MLELHDLQRRFGEITALDGLSLRARPGRLLGFLGPNGAGKTTSMRCVFGLVRPDAGHVSWQGEPLRADQLLRFGYMPEQRGLYPRMAAGAQLAYLARLHGVEKTAAAEAAATWLAELGLADRAEDRVSELSHGNQQRVQLAAALVHDPELLVLDEPFSGLDPLGVEAMSRVLRERAAAGATVVFSSHQLELVEDLCDDVVIIAAGRDRLSGTLDEVRASGGTRRVEVRLAGGIQPVLSSGEVEGVRDGRVRLVVPDDVQAGAILAELSGQGDVEVFTFEPPTLTEVFRATVGEVAA